MTLWLSFQCCEFGISHWAQVCKEITLTRPFDLNLDRCTHDCGSFLLARKMEKRRCGSILSCSSDCPYPKVELFSSKRRLVRLRFLFEGVILWVHGVARKPDPLLCSHRMTQGFPLVVLPSVQHHQCPPAQKLDCQDFWPFESWNRKKVPESAGIVNVKLHLSAEEGIWQNVRRILLERNLTA